MRIFLLSVAFMLGLISCSEKETPAGVKFSILKKGDGIEVETGKYILVHEVLFNHKDSLLLSTYALNKPMVMPMPDASMAGDTGEFGVIKMLTKGDCVTFKLPAKTVFTKRRRAVPKNIDPTSLFTFVLHMKETWTKEEAERFIDEQIKKVDSTIIAEHLKSKGLEALSTPSGLRYIITKEGNGETGAPGKTAYVHYAGYFLDGKMFDTSSAKMAKANNFNNGGTNRPYPVVINTGSVIKGWDEILQRMNKGMRVTVYVPSSLAYGPEGRSAIPPNTVLMFDMEVVDLK